MPDDTAEDTRKTSGLFSASIDYVDRVAEKEGSILDHAPESHALLRLSYITARTDEDTVIVTAQAARMPRDDEEGDRYGYVYEYVETHRITCTSSDVAPYIADYINDLIAPRVLSSPTHNISTPLITRIEAALRPLWGHVVDEYSDTLTDMHRRNIAGRLDLAPERERPAKVVVPVRLSPTHKAQLQEMADAEDVSVSGLLRAIVREVLG